jgi:hypothetical protein
MNDGMKATRPTGGEPAFAWRAPAAGNDGSAGRRAAYTRRGAFTKDNLSHYDRRLLVMLFVFLLLLAAALILSGCWRPLRPANYAALAVRVP